MNLDDEGIVNLILKYELDSKALREETLRLCWYMRGAISYDDAMLLSEEERTLIGKIIEDNIETTKKSGMPFF